jgi:hypothetical protein
MLGHPRGIAGEEGLEIVTADLLVGFLDAHGNLLLVEMLSCGCERT